MPSGATAISFAIVSVLASTSACADSTGAPKRSSKRAGSHAATRSPMLARSAEERSDSRMLGPARLAAVDASMNRPWMGPTYLAPNRSASYAGMMAYTPPMAEMAATVTPMKPYRGATSPVVTTAPTHAGTARYSGTLPSVNRWNAARRPMRFVWRLEDGGRRLPEH